MRAARCTCAAPARTAACPRCALVMGARCNQRPASRGLGNGLHPLIASWLVQGCLLTSLPASSSDGGFCTSTACCAGCAGLPPPPPPGCCCPPAPARPGAAPPATGVTWLHTAHLTDCAPNAYISVIWHPPHTTWPTWLACKGMQGAGGGRQGATQARRRASQVCLYSRRCVAVARWRGLRPRSSLPASCMARAALTDKRGRMGATLAAPATSALCFAASLPPSLPPARPAARGAAQAPPRCSASRCAALPQAPAHLHRAVEVAAHRALHLAGAARVHQHHPALRVVAHQLRHVAACTPGFRVSGGWGKGPGHEGRRQGCTHLWEEARR